MWSNLCKDALRLYRGQSAEEKRNLMNLVCSNPVFDGSNVIFTVHTAFAYALKSYNLVIRGRGSNPYDTNSHLLKPILLEMLKNYNTIDFYSIKLFKKCA